MAVGDFGLSGKEIPQKVMDLATCLAQGTLSGANINTSKTFLAGKRVASGVKR
jgi:hypothetical protein